MQNYTHSTTLEPELVDYYDYFPNTSHPDDSDYHVGCVQNYRKRKGRRRWLAFASNQEMHLKAFMHVMLMSLLESGSTK